MRRPEQGQGILMLAEVKTQVKITSLVRFEEEQQIALTHTAQSITILSQCYSQIKTPLSKAQTGCLQRMDGSLRLRCKQASYSKQYNYHSAADLQLLSFCILLAHGKCKVIWISLAFTEHLLSESCHLTAHVPKLCYFFFTRQVQAHCIHQACKLPLST